MAHDTVVTFQKGYAIVARGRRRKIVSADTGRAVLRGEVHIAFSTDLAPAKTVAQRTGWQRNPQNTAVQRARQALGLHSDDARVTACPNGPCPDCKQTGILYETS